MSRDNPSLGEVIVNDQEHWRDLPNINTPYYVLAREGMYIHRKTAQGRGIIPTFKKPTTPKPIGFPSGYFLFDGAPIPATIYAQAVHFFRRIFEKHHTEAEVIITQHKDTGEYRLFIPTQSVSHGGVSSIYNPTHVNQDYLTVGTFHSHCDFSPGHSGIDEGDARDMDGIHGTIGYVTRDVPEMALMYALNGKFFHFQQPFKDVVDDTDLTAATAPEWWDRYVITEKVTDADRQRIAPYADNEQWDKFMRRYKKPTPAPTKLKGNQNERRRPTDHTIMDDQDWTTWMMKNEEDYRNAGYLYDPDIRAYRWVGQQAIKDISPTRQKSMISPQADITSENADYWEDALGKVFLDALFDTNLFTEEDLIAALQSWPESGTEAYWETRMSNKLASAAKFLVQTCGLTVKVSVIDTRTKPLPGQIPLQLTQGAQA